MNERLHNLSLKVDDLKIKHKINENKENIFKNGMQNLINDHSKSVNLIESTISFIDEVINIEKM